MLFVVALLLSCDRKPPPPPPENDKKCDHVMCQAGYRPQGCDCVPIAAASTTAK